MELPVRHKLLELELLDLQLPELEFDPLLNVNSFLSSFIIFVKGKKKEKKKKESTIKRMQFCPEDLFHSNSL